MNNRIKEIRKALKLTQAEFGKKMGLSNNYIYMLESTSTPITEKFIVLLCNTFYVDRNWLETGEGEMFTALRREGRIAEITAMVYKREDLPPDKEDILYKILEVVAEMNADQIELVVDICKKIAKEQENI